jgi:hypothetical protein
VLEPPKGKTPRIGSRGRRSLFRATQFGDEVDRPLRKSDGSGTYFANDIANHLHKIERGFAELVHVWGADHGGYVKRMNAAVAALSDGKVKLDVVLTQIVHVVKGGQPVRMSKRAGTYVTLRDLIEEVGKDAVRFTMLTRKADAQMEFDLDKVVEQSRDNPVFYVQYAMPAAARAPQGWRPGAVGAGRGAAGGAVGPGRARPDPAHGRLAAHGGGRRGGAGAAPNRLFSPRLGRGLSCIVEQGGCRHDSQVHPGG